jgi:hypothetical protein
MQLSAGNEARAVTKEGHVDRALRTRMVFHGAAVVLLGMLAGFPYAFVVTGDLPGSERAWRMAHLEGVLNGLLMLAVAGVGGRLALSAGQARVLFWALVVTGYGNVVAAVIGATFAVRGLAPGGSFSNTIVYTLFMVAIGGVFVALGLVALGARRRPPAPEHAEERRMRA